MTRYSDILASGQLQQARENLLNYYNTPRQRNVGSRGPRPPRQAAFVLPFGLDLATDELAATTVGEADYAALAARINTAGTGAEVTDTLGAKEVAPLPSFTPAKVVWFRNATVSSTVARSAITNLEYLKYNGDRSTCPFGRKTETDNIHDAFQKVRTVLRSQPNLDLNRVSLVREKISYR